MMSTQLSQIAKKAKLNRTVRFTSLAHLLTPELLTETWGMMNRRAASGIDGESTEQFESELKQRGEEICAQLRAGAYRAPAVRRVETQRPRQNRNAPIGDPHGRGSAAAASGSAHYRGRVRSGFPRLQLRLSAGAQPSPRSAGAALADRVQEGEPRIRGRYPQLLHPHQSSVVTQDGGPPDRRPGNS